MPRDDRYDNTLGACPMCDQAWTGTKELPVMCPGCGEVIPEIKSK